MMWALEYHPDLFDLYEEADSYDSKGEGSKGKMKSIHQCGKFERENLRAKKAVAPLPISVFLVANVLKEKSSKLLTEAKGLDDVVKVRLISFSSIIFENSKLHILLREDRIVWSIRTHERGLLGSAGINSG